jgi:hypothetical protein
LNDQPAVEALDPMLLAETLSELTERLNLVEQILGKVVEALESGIAHGPWAWAHLDPQAQRALFDELREWVDWLVMRYHVSDEAYRLQPCWYRHPVAVEELTALMVAWKAEYSQPKASTGLTAWHTQSLWPCLLRLNHDLKLFAACQRAGVHVAKDVEAPVTDVVDFAAFLDTPLDAITSKNDDLSLPAAALSGADVERLVERGQAQRMFTDEPNGPVLVDQHWYAVEEGSTDGLLRPVSAEHASQLDALAQRLALAGASGRGAL